MAERSGGSGGSRATPHPHGAGALAGRFNALSPEIVLDAVQVPGFEPTGRFVILNSYENRVYQLELEQGDTRTFLVGKFYRPGRWSVAAINDEHDFLFDLHRDEIPVVLPIAFDDDETTLAELSGEAAGIHYALFPRVGGRAPEEFTPTQLQVLGRLLARIHNVGEAHDAPHRPVLDPDTYGLQNLAFLLDNAVIPEAARDGFAFTVEALVKRIAPLFEQVPMHRIHGDCHRGNLIDTRDGLVFLDFDDMLIGPAVQDVWMLVPSFDAAGARDRALLLEAYCEFRDFDPAWLQLIEPLRALRMIHYATWIARRFDDPIFRRTFTHFGTLRYWQSETLDLREQIARIDLAT